jgi:hypothetical protein
MRIAAGLLASLAAGAVTIALADPPTEAAAAPAQQAAPAAPATAATPAATSSSSVTITSTAPAPAKPEIDKDTQHFLAEGYKPEMRHGEQVYCKKDAALGSRVNQVKTCGTLEQLKLQERAARENVSNMQRSQTGTSSH